MSDNVTRTKHRKRDRVKAHVAKNKAKYAGALTVLVLVLQLMGQLAPLYCHMPWVTNTEACLAQGVRAKEAAKSLGELDAMALDAAPLLLIEEEGGHQ